MEQQFLLNLLGTVITIVELKALELDDGVDKVHEASSERLHDDAKVYQGGLASRDSFLEGEVQLDVGYLDVVDVDETAFSAKFLFLEDLPATLLLV